MTDFNQFNPLYIDHSDQISTFRTPGGLLTRVLQYAIPLAGLILFVMIVWGGFEMLSGATSSKTKDAGKQRVTAAITGFLLLFASYWIVQLIEVIFNVRILK